MGQLDIFGNEENEFRSAKERFGVWPMTVWDCDMADPAVRRLKALVADSGTERHARVDGTFGYQRGASQFNPAVAAWILNCYAPTEAGAVCFDPFAGGGTRAIMAAAHGLRYVGTELRVAEVTAVRERAQRAGYADAVTIYEADARDCRGYVGDDQADFLYTCPPYWNLERYGGGPADLSECDDYGGFVHGLLEVVTETRAVLKPGAHAVWVVGLHRHPNGALAPLHHDVARIHKQAGFYFKEEIILAHRNNGAVQRVGSFDKGNRRLIRAHEYALVFIAPEKEGRR